MDKIDYNKILADCLDNDIMMGTSDMFHYCMKEVVKAAIPLVLKEAEKQLDKKLRELFDKANNDNIQVRHCLVIGWGDIADKLVEKKSITSLEEELIKQLTT